MTSDGEDEFDVSLLSSSSAASSTPVDKGTYVPVQPVYVVTVTKPVKNGDLVQYTVTATTLSDDTQFTVTRQYEDFEYLHHCLHFENHNDGIIVSITTCCLFLLQAWCRPQ